MPLVLWAFSVLTLFAFVSLAKNNGFKITLKHYYLLLIFGVILFVGTTIYMYKEIHEPAFFLALVVGTVFGLIVYSVTNKAAKSIEKAAKNIEAYNEYNKSTKQKSSKDASVIGRAVVGGIVAGRAGAVVGALSAVDKNNKNRSENNSSK